MQTDVEAFIWIRVISILNSILHRDAAVAQHLEDQNGRPRYPLKAYLYTLTLVIRIK